MKNIIVAVLVFALAAALIYVAVGMPPIGEASNPVFVNTAPRYLEHAAEEAGTENIVTGIVLNYRGYDTMGEVTVIFSALTSVLAVLSVESSKTQRRADGGDTGASLLIRTVVVFLLPFIILFSLYTILHGDVSPGGGFQGGAIIAAGFTVYLIVFGRLGSPLELPTRFLLPLEGAAVVAFFLTGILGVMTGTNFLTYILPGVAPALQPVVRTLMLLFLEAGIGTGGASIFVAIFGALREAD
jgi:multicomponent Na+:H+ antiporter subunit B